MGVIPISAGSNALLIGGQRGAHVVFVVIRTFGRHGEQGQLTVERGMPLRHHAPPLAWTTEKRAVPTPPRAGTAGGRIRRVHPVDQQRGSINRVCRSTEWDDHRVGGGGTGPGGVGTGPGGVGPGGAGGPGGVGSGPGGDGTGPGPGGGTGSGSGSGGTGWSTATTSPSFRVSSLRSLSACAAIRFMAITYPDPAAGNRR